MINYLIRLKIRLFGSHTFTILSKEVSLDYSTVETSEDLLEIMLAKYTNRLMKYCRDMRIRYMTPSIVNGWTKITVTYRRRSSIATVIVFRDDRKTSAINFKHNRSDLTG